MPLRIVVSPGPVLFAALKKAVWNAVFLFRNRAILLNNIFHGVASEKMQIYNDMKYTIQIFMQIKEQVQQV
ncbi:hypothetical protein A9986_11925 [Solibacillus silvestris]|nr:hypothetical protein A9986_11925 [Solibacillus silvestris]